LKSRVFVVVVALALVAAACDLVLGIRDYPLRDAGAVAVGDAGADGQGGCLDPSLGCGACPHDFCDDFDQAGQVPNSKWPGTFGLASPFLRGDAGVELGEGRSPPSALRVHATSPTSTPSHAFLVRRLDGPDGGVALRFSFDARLDRLELLDTVGPVKDAGAVSIAAILSPVAGAPSGAAIVLSTDGLYLAVSDNVLDSPDASILPFYQGSLAPLAGNWVRIEMFAGPAAEAARLGFARCASLQGGVAAARLTALGLSSCAPLPAALADLAWIRSPVILTGAFLFGQGRVEVRVDNVTADFVQ